MDNKKTETAKSNGLWSSIFNNKVNKVQSKDTIDHNANLDNDDTNKTKLTAEKTTTTVESGGIWSSITKVFQSKEPIDHDVDVDKGDTNKIKLTSETTTITAEAGGKLSNITSKETVDHDVDKGKDDANKTKLTAETTTTTVESGGMWSGITKVFQSKETIDRDVDTNKGDTNKIKLTSETTTITAEPGGKLSNITSKETIDHDVDKGKDDANKTKLTAETTTTTVESDGMWSGITKVFQSKETIDHDVDMDKGDTNKTKLTSETTTITAEPSLKLSNITSKETIDHDKDDTLITETPTTMVAPGGMWSNITKAFESKETIDRDEDMDNDDTNQTKLTSETTTITAESGGILSNITSMNVVATATEGITKLTEEVRKTSVDVVSDAKTGVAKITEEVRTRSADVAATAAEGVTKLREEVRKASADVVATATEGVTTIAEASVDVVSTVTEGATILAEEVHKAGEEAVAAATEAFEEFNHIIENIKKYGHLFSNLKENVSKRNKDRSVHPEIEWEAKVRKSNELCEEEKNFLNERIPYIREAFAKYVEVGVDEIHLDDIPIIAFAGSGGGFRAMIANTAYMKAMHDSGLFDCGVYFGGVSGCCLALATQYSSAYATKENPPEAILDDFKERLKLHIINISHLFETKSPEAAVELAFAGLIGKMEAGIDLHLVDIFGSLLAAKLLVGRDPETQILNFEDFKLSQQRRYLEGGKKMMPIYTAVRHINEKAEQAENEKAEHEQAENEKAEHEKAEHDQAENEKAENEKAEHEKAEHEQAENEKAEHEKAKDKEAEQQRFSWYEFTPFEVGSYEVAEWVPTWAFGRKFKSGNEHEDSLQLPEQKLPEQNIGQLLGMVGSAPCVPVSGYISKIRHVLPEGLKDGFNATYDGVFELVGGKCTFEGIKVIPPAQNYNYAYKPDEMESDLIEFIDSGVSNDLPLDPMVHPSRKVDVIVALDSSGITAKYEFFEEQQKDFTSRRGIKREELDVENKYCKIYDYEYIPNGTINGEINEHTTTARHCKFCYVPYLANEKVDEGNFIPHSDKSTSFAKFVYDSEVIDKMISLAEANWSEAKENVKKVIVDAWKEKRKDRLSK